MITIIARFKMQAGKEEEALQSTRKMAEAVQANEPGALAYFAHRSQEDPLEIMFFEVYAGDDAFQAHAQTPHMAEMRSAFPQLFDVSQVKVERWERVGGFARPEAG